MNQNRVLLLLTVGLVLFLSACSTEETFRTYERTEITNNAIKNTSLEEEIDAGGRKKLNKKTTTEKIKCVGKDGRLRSSTFSDCVQQQGKVANKIFQE